MTFKKYITTLTLITAILALLFSMLPVVTKSHVAVGTVIEESWKHDFVLEAGNDRYYEVDAAMVSGLEQAIQFTGHGALKIRSASLKVTPKQVKWSKGKNRSVTAPGAELATTIRWELPSDVADGTRGEVRIDIPEFNEKFHSGSFQRVGDHYVFREATGYHGAFSLAMGRLGYAFWVAMPVALAIHSLWLLITLPRVQSASAAAEAAAAVTTPLPRLFGANPVAEWQVWVLIMLIFGGSAALIACVAIFMGFMSSSFLIFIGAILGVGVLVGLLFVWIVSKRVITVKVEAETLSYAKGRGTPRWIQAAWRDVVSVTPKSRKVRHGVNEWLEVVFPGGKKQNFTNTNVTDFKALREVIETLYAHHRRPPADAQ